MTQKPKIAFVGAGSTVFMKNIVGDVLLRDALSSAHIALMDIDPIRLAESEIVAKKIISTLKVSATLSTHLDQRDALKDANFVVSTFQIGGYDPCTITDFEIPKKYNLRQTIADTLGVGGIMRGLRTVPHLWKICEDIQDVCPNALLLQYVNPMCINMGAIFAKFPKIDAVGLCHSVQGTAAELAHDLGVKYEDLRYSAAGINHMSFYTRFELRQKDGTYIDLYPELLKGYREGRFPKEITESSMPHVLRCKNIVRYEMMARLGYFVTESSEHFAEYVPWFIKNGRNDLIEKFSVPLDEYQVRCVEANQEWEDQTKAYRESETINVCESKEYASSIMNSVWTGTPSVIYGNVRNDGAISSLPDDAIVEVPCLVDRNGIQPTRVGALPTQITALIRTNLNVQELTIKGIMEENKDYIYQAAMMDPHTGAELDLEQIWSLVDDLVDAHGDWLPDWLNQKSSTAH